jgi:hypothetical protein
MAATEKRNIWLWSGDMEVVTRPIAASQGIYMPGALCYVSTSGTVKLADTSDGTGDVVHGIILDGVAAELAANTEIKIGLVTIDQVWAVYTENNDSDVAVTQAAVGNEYGFRIATGAGKIGYCTLDLNNSNDTVTVFDIASNVEPSKFTTSDNPGVALVKFLRAAIEAEKA